MTKCRNCGHEIKLGGAFGTIWYHNERQLGLRCGAKIKTNNIRTKLLCGCNIPQPQEEKE